MQISYSPKPHNTVDYYPLPNGLADVFMHRNETAELDDEGGTVYAAEEVHYQVNQSITKDYIETNFDSMWNDGGKTIAAPTDAERISALESALLSII